MNLFTKQFVLSTTKFVDVYISKTENISLRFTSVVDKPKKTVNLTVNDIYVILENKSDILSYLDSPSLETNFNILLTQSQRGETRISGSVYNDEPFVNIRYYHTSNDKNGPVGTRFGLLLNVLETIQLFNIITELVNYIKYLQKYNRNIYHLYSVMVDHLYLCTMNTYDKTLSTLFNINTYLTTHYRDISNMVDKQLVSSDYVSLCKSKTLQIGLGQSDLMDLISLFFKNEKDNLISGVTKKHNSVILKSMLSDSSKPVDYL
jgi:hypothetical protein